MSRLQSFPIAGGAYKDDTLPWSAQDTVNWIPVIAEQPGTTSPILLRGVPGYAPIAVGGAQAAGMPVRGGYDADGFGVVVIGQTLYKFDGTSALLALGTVPGIQRVSFSHNQVAGGVQIAIANGTGGYVYDTSNSMFQPITDDAFPGARTFGYLDSYIIGVEPGGNYWFVSALADATSYSTLDRYQAESEPDRIMTALVSHSDVVILGARTTEFWFDAGTQTDTFQRRDGTGFEIGCSSSFAAVNLDNTVYWRGNDGSAYRLAGYTPERISTGPVEQAWARCDPSQCYAMTYVDRGHKIVYFTHPDGQTFGFDAATQLWHRRQSYRMNRWRPSCLFNYSGKWYAGDFTNGSIALLDWGCNTENGQPLIAERSTTVIQDDRNRFRLNAVEVLFDSQKSTVVSAQSYILNLTGHLPNGGVGDDVDYAYQIGATDSPAIVTVSAASLPPGVTLSASGKATGSYTTAGSYSWTVEATDSSGHPVTLNDSATITPLLAAHFSNAGDVLSAPMLAPILGDSDFTIQARVSPHGSGLCGIISTRSTISNATGWALEKAEGSVAEWRQSTTGVNMDSTSNLSGSDTIPADELTHIAVTRSGNTFTLWINGTEADRKTITGFVTEDSDHIGIGTSFLDNDTPSSSENQFFGYMAWLSVHIGDSLYNESFTPPTLPPSSAQILLAFNEAVGSTTFADTGTLGLTWTNLGNVVIAEYPY